MTTLDDYLANHFADSATAAAIGALGQAAARISAEIRRRGRFLMPLPAR